MELLQRKPNNKELLNNIAQAMYDTKNYDDAISYYEKLLTLNPKDAQSLFMAGMTFQKKGEKKRARRYAIRQLKWILLLQVIARSRSYQCNGKINFLRVLKFLAAIIGYGHF